MRYCAAASLTDVIVLLVPRSYHKLIELWDGGEPTLITKGLRTHIRIPLSPMPRIREFHPRERSIQDGGGGKLAVWHWSYITNTNFISQYTNIIVTIFLMSLACTFKIIWKRGILKKKKYFFLFLREHRS